MALTTVTIPVPDALHASSTWVPSTLVQGTGVSLTGPFAPGDACTVYGTTDDAIAVTDGVIVGTVVVAASGNLTVSLTARAWNDFPFIGSTRDAGTSTGVDLKISGDDGAEGSATDPVPVESVYQPGAVDNVGNGVTRGTYGTTNVPASAAKYGALPFANTRANVTLNIVSRPVNVLGIYCLNFNAAARYIQVHDTAGVPSSGSSTTPLSFYVPAAVAGVPGITVIGADVLSQNGVFLKLGAAFAFSTTDFTYTAGVATDQVTRITYTPP